jgi:membrane fusion protein (multidrug efflux system)
VQWPVKRPQPSLLVPPTSVVTTTERTFVIRVKTDGTAEWVNVGRGARVGDLIEVFGPLRQGDAIVRRGSDELREGVKLKAQTPKTN